MLEFVAHMRVGLAVVQTTTLSKPRPKGAPRKMAARRKRAGPSRAHRLHENNGRLQCVDRLRFATSGARRQELKASEYDGPHAGSLYAAQLGHTVAKAGPYVFCVACGGFERKMAVKLRKPCVGLPADACSRRFRDRLLQGKDPYTGEALPHWT